MTTALVGWDHKVALATSAMLLQAGQKSLSSRKQTKH